MIKNKIIPLFAVLLSLVSCNDTPSQDYYDYNWTKGETAIEINQPTVKNPQAQLSNLNKMRQTQNKLGLSSLGQSNILVVPVEFKGDDELKDSYKKLGYDIDFNIFDVKHIDDAGTIFVSWDCGSGLGVAYGEDKIKKIKEEEIEVI